MIRGSILGTAIQVLVWDGPIGVGAHVGRWVLAGEVLGTVMDMVTVILIITTAGVTHTMDMAIIGDTTPTTAVGDTLITDMATAVETTTLIRATAIRYARQDRPFVRIQEISSTDV